MEVPLPRTPSSHSVYAPGPHRRSHPNLQHLSLAPLTPRYPIDPADYHAYHDPSTSSLHTSKSISHIAGLPSPGGILGGNNSGGSGANSPALARSRANSRTRVMKRRVKSGVDIPTAADGATPSGAVSSSGYGYSGELRPLAQVSSDGMRGTRSHVQLSTAAAAMARGFEVDESSWLVQTGLALTESSRENKGQSWLGKKESSTSLAGLVSTPVSPVEERGRGAGIGGLSFINNTYGNGSASGLNVGAYVRSGRATPNRSRVNSRHGSRRGSRRTLAMTPASPVVDKPVQSEPKQAPARQEEEDIQPDWADADTKAEALQQRQPSGYFSKLLGGPAPEDDTENRFYDLEEEPYDDEFVDDDDPYENIQLAEHFDNGSDVLDEEEVRREIKKTGVVGRWFDGVVDAFLMLEDGDGEGDFFDDKDGDEKRRNLGDDVEEGIASGSAPTTKGGETDGKVIDVEAPPDQPQGVWDDVKWLGRLVARSVGS